MSSQAFHNLRSPGSLYEHTQKVVKTKFVAIRRYAEHYTIDFSRRSNEDDLIREVRSNIKELKVQGIKIDISPWHLVAYIRRSWYHLLQTRYAPASS